ncbi:hypothetical protein CSUB01_12377 [Colletotrichum sublineola]|uniref:C2H2-type domain-containing protein n=1 Tax=Colletotrichum sublineola TaxID=1173701 RepID=A0A066XPQ6_COLSU|nr:hypothetical protein CSUB01_12377 [Colletotrichum sublineola]
MAFRCGTCSAAWESRVSRDQHVAAKGHIVPAFEYNSCGRFFKSQGALDQHKDGLNHWADSASASHCEPVCSSGGDPDDSRIFEEPMQVLLLDKPSNILDSTTSEDENTVDEEENNLDEITIQMEHLGFDAAVQHQDEVLSSPLITVPLLRASPPLQFGLFGGSVSQSCPLSQASRLFYNVTCPSSVFICGSQGSGKSNTLACLLENCLIPSKLGNLLKPLAGIVFHFDSFVSDAGGLLCEAAFLASDNETLV